MIAIPMSAFEPQDTMLGTQCEAHDRKLNMAVWGLWWSLREECLRFTDFMEWLTQIFWTFDIVMSLLTGYVHKGQLVTWKRDESCDRKHRTNGTVRWCHLGSSSSTIWILQWSVSSWLRGSVTICDTMPSWTQEDMVCAALDATKWLLFYCAGRSIVDQELPRLDLVVVGPDWLLASILVLDCSMTWKGFHVDWVHPIQIFRMPSDVACYLSTLTKNERMASNNIAVWTCLIYM